ncbi:hypothetical protein N0V95_009112 [Ascochyta clinopodiicola]|nr:hypothetical protein N0V95_009112 [Ascochyta clinopodiicola]
MKSTIYDGMIDDAMKGAIPSGTFLSALRLVFGVYGYMTDSGVVAHLNSINGNIRKELSNAGALYNEPRINLVPIWDDFFKAQFTKAEDHGKKWLLTRFPATETKIEASRKKCTRLATTLKKAEEGKDAAKHADMQKKAQTELETKMKSQEGLVTTAKQTVADLKKLRTIGTAAQKTGLAGKIIVAKKALHEEEKAVAITQRVIHELYSHSVNLIVKNLEKDSARVSNFEKAIAALKLTPP